MLKGCGRMLPGGVLIILALALFTIGGCDIEFGGGGNNGGGGGGGGNRIEIVEGTIIDVMPEQGVDGITVDISVAGALPEFDITDDNGFFSVDGALAGNAMIEFVSVEGTFLGSIFVEVFPTARVVLGDIILENGMVKLQDINPEVTFEAEVIQNNCTGNSGSMQVEASNNRGNATVIVQISPSTDLIINGDDVNCQAIRVGRDVEVQGDLISSSTIDASRVEID